MSFDIFNIEPNKVSRDLKGKIVSIYGDPKTGKTTTATQFPKSILAAFEKGYNAISGVRAAPIQKWSDFKKMLKQLSTDKAHEIYETVIIDTADIAFDLCEKYICQRESVDKIGDIPFGGGYKMLKDEFNEALRSIPMMNYGLVMISHAQSRTFTDENGEEFNKMTPTLPERPRQIVLGMSDLIGYARSVKYEDGQKTVLYLRGTSRFEAGSRFKHTPDVIDFNYESLVNAISDAIEKEVEGKSQDSVTNEHINLYEVSEQVSFEDTMKKATEVIKELVGKDGENNPPKITRIVDKYLGKGKKLAEANEDQVDIIGLIIDDLKDLLKESE